MSFAVCSIGLYSGLSIITQAINDSSYTNFFVDCIKYCKQAKQNNSNDFQTEKKLV